MGTVTAIEEVDRIRRELRELELKNSPCPVDRRRAEKEAEARAQEAQAAQEQKTAANWAAWVDHRIVQYLDHYCLHVFEHDDNDKLSIMTASLAELIRLERMGRRKKVNAAIEEEWQSVDAKLAKLEQRLKSSPGKLPVVKSSWQPESVIYQSEMVAHNGATYQAKRDTAQKPRGSDWILIARHGRDAISPVVCGAYDVNDSYAELDIITFDGAAYIARSASPGLCPGEGWEPCKAAAVRPSKARKARRARRATRATTRWRL
jgi:hypothetical protein